jgi:hypothetical protein
MNTAMPGITIAPSFVKTTPVAANYSAIAPAMRPTLTWTVTREKTLRST